MNLFDRFVSLCGDKDKKNEALEVFEYTLSDNTWEYVETYVTTRQIRNAQENLDTIFKKYGAMISGRQLNIEKHSPKTARFADEFYFDIIIEDLRVGRIFFTADCYKDLVKKNVNRVYAEIVQETAVINNKVETVNVLKMFFKLGTYDGVTYKLGDNTSKSSFNSKFEKRGEMKIS